MPRKKKKTFPSVLAKYVFLACCAVALVLFLSKQTVRSFTGSRYFAVEAVEVDPLLSFISESEFRRYYGRNIFEIDLREIHNRISYKYPQVSDIKVMRMFPDQIRVLAQQRIPAAQVVLGDAVLTIDDKGYVLSTTTPPDEDLPLITGLRPSRRFHLGLPLEGRRIHSGLRIIHSHAADELLSGHSLRTIDVGKPSRISFLLDNGLNVIVDDEKIGRKMDVLNVVMKKGQLKYDEIEYLDLRFREPVIGYHQGDE